jgi:hypothetical protein
LRCHDLYLQNEVEVALHPTLTRVWSRAGKLGIQTPKGSRLLRELLAELGEQLVLVYTPTHDPDANRIEWLWRALRRGEDDKRAVRLPGALSTVVCARAAGDRLSRGRRRPASARSR